MPTLDWIGKQAVLHHHRDVPYRLIHCDKDLSAGDPDAGNLLVQGDNLEALKALQPYYAGKVKCIYIDPPYNTGNEGWVYNDNVNSPEMKKWLGQVVGKEAEDLSRHDKWLCMMYPRLRLLREFLSEDGAIFVSIDDNEVAHLRILMDEIFAPQNFLVNFIWQKKYTRANDAKYVSDNHDHILAFAKHKSNFSINGSPRSAKQDRAYKNPDNDINGPWKATPIHAKSGTENNIGEYEFSNGLKWTPPKGTFHRYSKGTLAELDRTGQLWFGKTGTGAPSRKSYLSEVSQTLVPVSLITYEEGGSNHDAKSDIREIFGEVIFDTPKPKKLLQLIAQLSTNPNDIVLDSFAGSGTTGHAVLDLNKQDGGNRKFICVEMDETIASDVTAERLKRVINGYDKTKGDKTEHVEGLGSGFRFCRLGTPLFNEFGGIAPEVSYSDLAAHIFFSETGSPIPQKADGTTTLLGTFQGRAVYLLFDAATQGFASEDAGNSLTLDMLDKLPLPAPDFDGTRVVYAEGCAISEARLRDENITFRQIPYQIGGA